MATVIPKAIKGIQIKKTSRVKVLDYRTDLLVPTLIEGEILIKNNFISINYINTYFYYILLLPSILNSLTSCNSYN
jgi:NADPH:quinone reductase